MIRRIPLLWIVVLAACAGPPDGGSRSAGATAPQDPRAATRVADEPARAVAEPRTPGGVPDPDPSPAAARHEVAARRFVATGPPVLPRIGALTLETTPDGWTRLDARDGDARVFGYEVLLAEGDVLAPEAGKSIRRYILYPAQGDPLEIVDARDGTPLLPRAVGPDWLPRRADGRDDEVVFLGRTFREARGGNPPAADWPRDAAVRQVLDLECLVATSRPFRDDGTGRHGKDYRWVPLSAADYDRMIRAGFNCFAASGTDLVRLAGEPVFLVARDGWDRLPDLPLRGSYLGAVMYADEPGIHVMGGWGFKAAQPGEVALAIGDETRRVLSGDGVYGSGFLAAQMTKVGVDYGAVAEPPYPVWEALASAAWVELEAGADGICYEARLDPRRFAEDVRKATGVEFPAESRPCVELCLATLRGAARRFDRPWGVSVYGQMADDAADVLFPMAWDEGATYFWTWTSDGDHHVPWERQLQLVEALAQHARDNPRVPPARRTRTYGQVALVLPWGYSLDDYTFGRWSDVPSLWNVPALRLQRTGGDGPGYAGVLASAMREALDLLASGEPFDVLFLRPGETPDSGYRETRRVSEDGTVSRTGP